MFSPLSITCSSQKYPQIQWSWNCWWSCSPPPLKAQCSGLCPYGSWLSPARETPPPLWATYSSAPSFALPAKSSWDTALRGFVDGCGKPCHGGKPGFEPPLKGTTQAPSFVCKLPFPDKVGKWERRVLQLTIAPCSCQVQAEWVSCRKVNVNVTFLQQKLANCVAKTSIKVVSDF